MTKKTNKELTAEETKIQQIQIEETKQVAKKIEDILVESGRAIQPYLQFSEGGITAQIRVIVVPKKKDEQK